MNKSNIIQIIHVRVGVTRWTVPIFEDIDFTEPRWLEEPEYPTSFRYEDIYLYKYENESFKYGYGLESKVLVVADIP